jgi:V/A-type H+-transporting ATPase subunit D
MNQASPTRTELLALQGQIKLAEQGAELLRSKREALMREFLAELRKFTAARETMRRSVRHAVQELMRALSVDGPEAVASAGLVCARPVNVEIEPQNIWGTRVLDIHSDYTIQSATQRQLDKAGTSARIEETAERFEQALADILRIAPLDLKIRALAADMRKTSRRVNALEQRLLPTLNQQVRYIRDTLDQREREDIFRLKKLKQKKMKQKQADA